MVTPSPTEAPGRAALVDPEPTPTYGPGGAFTISCSTRIGATPRACLDVLITAAEYPTWNRFCRKCTIDSQPEAASDSETEGSSNNQLRLGTHFTFDVHMNLDDADGSTGQAVALDVSVLEPIDEESSGAGGPRKGWRIAWKQRASLLMPGWMLRSERVQEFVEVPGSGEGGPETEYRCWETFYGALAPVVKLAVGKQVQRGFDAWAEGLKARAEGRAIVNAG
ncbi:uncharacterized protein B0T15DRAFT_52988 [Chaetomium strumarium]|uniref:Coenzyme Q-binding protein COQ10 START domain-containing protein n=1 Tax=Chaetomium strumarium TaxID=1170767 RepID=A0AAJ0M6R0_9PEZI|nr:hypothetical protein B0T15DRAFT_52988 [Chaetomium strumarium]